MAFNPITNTEIQDGAPADTQLFTKVKDNFNNHEARLLAEEADVNVIHAVQIAIDDVPGIYAAVNIEDALIEVMEKVNDNQDSNTTLLTAHAGRLTAVEGRATAIETLNGTQDTRLSNTESNITTLQSTASNHNSRLTSAESSITGNSNNITSLANRATALEGRATALEAISDKNEVLSMGCASVNKAVFLANCTLTGGTAVYNATAANQTGQGAITSTAVAMEVLYNSFIPFSMLMGIGYNAIFSFPTGATVKVGFKCFDGTKAAIAGTYEVTASSTGTFQLVEGHYLGANLPAATRFVKPYISWTNNTGTMILDYLSVVPLGFSRYAILG